MRSIIAVIVSTIILVTNAYSGSEDILGTFQGTEKRTVTNCGTYNGTTTGSWTVTHSDLQGSTIKASGTNYDGTFTAVLNISGDTISGPAKGVNKWGFAWSGEFDATVDGDNYVATTTGTGSTGCKFTSDTQATRK